MHLVKERGRGVIEASSSEQRPYVESCYCFEIRTRQARAVYCIVLYRITRDTFIVLKAQSGGYNDKRHCERRQPLRTKRSVIETSTLTRENKRVCVFEINRADR